MRLGEKIKLLRNELELTQPDLAAKAGIEQSYLSKVENEKGMPSFEIIERIAQALETTAFDLIDSLDPVYVKGNLSHIPEIAARYAQEKMKQDQRLKRRFIFGAVMIAFGMFMVIVGNASILMPETFYQYQSEGELKPGESIYQFEARPLMEIGETRAEMNSRIRSNRERINEKSILINDYRGENFVEEKDGKRRMFRLIRDKFVPQPLNEMAIAMGMMILLVGGFTIAFAFRFKQS